MEHTGDALTRILNSPESLQKIAEIAKTLQTENGAEQRPPAEAAEQVVTGEADTGSTGELTSLLDGLQGNPATMKLITALANSYGQSNRQTRLLEALRPFAHGKNAGTINQAIRAVWIAKAARAILANWGEGDHLV